MYLNIAACNIKKKAWSEAAAACDEALALDSQNIRAYYRRARATALPINAGVPDLRQAVVDLDKTLELYVEQGHGNYDYVIKEKDRVQELIDINYKREQETYSKMFSSKTSVAEFVAKSSQGTDALKFKSQEEKEFEKELERIDQEVAEMVSTKMSEFSFEVDPEMKVQDIKELEDVQTIIDKCIEGYRIYKKTGKHKDAELMKEKIKETKYAKEHLKLVMNLDFTRPTPKLVEFAKKNQVNLHDPHIIEEFKKIQLQNLTDIHLMKDGKKPPTHAELQQRLAEEREQEFKKRMEDMETKNAESEKKVEEYTRLVQHNAKENDKQIQEIKEDASQKQQTRDVLFLAAIALTWLLLVVYANYKFGGEETPAVSSDALRGGHRTLGLDQEAEEL
jgi:hypothetical protein